MDKKISFGLRGVIGLFSFLFLYLTIILILDVIGGNLNLDSSLIIKFFVYFIIFYLLLIVALKWKTIFKSLTGFIISIGLFFLTLSFLLIPLNSNVENISSSIQPTMDLFIVNSIDSMLVDSNSEPINQDVKIVFSNNTETKRIYAENFSIDDRDYVLEQLGFSFTTEEEKNEFTIFIINQMYEKIETENPELKDVPVPLSQAKDMIAAQVDPAMLDLIDVSLLSSTYTHNPQSNIYVIISENEESKIINPTTLSSQDVELIWTNFGLKSDVDSDLKRNIVIMFFNQMIEPNRENLDLLNEMSIPISSIKEMMPDDLNVLFSSDLLSINISKRALALEELRTYCKKKEDIENISSSINQEVNICQAILMTQYDVLMNNATKTLNSQEDEVSSMIGSNLNFGSAFEDFSTIEKLETKLNDSSNEGFLFLIIGVFLIVFSGFVYWCHFGLFDRELVGMHIPYYVSKINLIKYIFSFIFFLIFYLILKSSSLVNTLANIMPQELGITGDFISNLPLFKVILDLNESIFFLILIYLIISVCLYFTFYFLLKNAVKNTGDEKKDINEKSNTEEAKEEIKEDKEDKKQNEDENNEKENNE